MSEVTQSVKQVGTIRSERSDPDSANTKSHKPSVIAGTSDGLWVLESEQHIELEGYSITALALSSDGPWAVVAPNLVWHRNLDGEWRRVASTSDSLLRLNCILPVDQTVLVGTSDAHLMRVVDDSIKTVDSFDQAEGRDKWYTPWGGPPDVRSLALGASGELYVNIHVGGILRSDDRGQSWQPTLDLHADVHEVRTIPERAGLVLAATAEGLAISQDRGESWNFDRANLHAAYARAVAVCGDIILMSASLGPNGGKAAIYRRRLDQPGTFEKCDRGLPEWFSDNINTRCLATSGNLAAFGTSDGQIFLSNDVGLTWEQITGGLAPIQCLSLV